MSSAVTNLLRGQPCSVCKPKCTVGHAITMAVTRVSADDDAGHLKGNLIELILAADDDETQLIDSLAHAVSEDKNRRIVKRKREEETEKLKEKETAEDNMVQRRQIEVGKLNLTYDVKVTAQGFSLFLTPEAQKGGSHANNLYTAIEKWLEKEIGIVDGDFNAVHLQADIEDDDLFLNEVKMLGERFDEDTLAKCFLRD
jgi:hypothetical protein